MREFAWDLWRACNYRCEYCIHAHDRWGDLPGSPGRIEAPATIEKAWKTIRARYGEALIRLSGGEPFLYPSFAETAALLARHHRLHITTNLSRPLDGFIANNDPSRIAINATFHPRRSDLKTFARAVLRLREAGFTCGTCYLAHPLQLREMFHYKRYFKETGFDLAVTPFQGMFNGRQYPEGYTGEERAYFLATARWTPRLDGDIDGLRTEPGGADEGYRQQVRGLAPAASPGTKCRAGYECAVVTAEGTVHRCGRRAEPEMGNIYEGNVELFDDARECAEPGCPDGAGMSVLPRGDA